MLVLTGLNHITLAVTDLSRSIEFYVSLPGFRLVARWEAGAYLSLNDLWLCLSLDGGDLPEKRVDYTHYAFSVAEGDFKELIARLRFLNVNEWKSNTSEGESIYFLDPWLPLGGTCRKPGLAA
jgi:catechol 2,3-dioxygenase-like lactoylglutathione lyase family enzyme